PSAPELNHLWALITHASPARSALARRPRGSDPETSGSVIAKNERISPATSGRSQRAFCSGVPNSWRISALPVSGAWQPKTRGAAAHRGTARRPAPADCTTGVIDARNEGERMHTKELFDLSGRVAIVTGGGSGLGRQMATALAEMGADVVLCARNAERCAQTA